MGDRVVSTFDQGSVPLGLKGTVVGMEGLFLQVLFDRTFMGGITLEGRCAPYRGAIVAKDTVLNLSKQQPPIRGGQGRRAVSAGKPKDNFSRSNRDRPASAPKSAWKAREAKNVTDEQTVKEEIRQSLGAKATVAVPQRTTPPVSNNSGLKVQLVKKQSNVKVLSRNGSAETISVQEKTIVAPAAQPTLSEEDQIAASIKSMLKIQSSVARAVPATSYAPMVSMPMPGYPPAQAFPGMVNPFVYPPRECAGPPEPYAKHPPQSNVTAANGSQTAPSPGSMGNSNVLSQIMNSLQGAGSVSPYQVSETKTMPAPNTELQDVFKSSRPQSGRGRGRGRGRGSQKRQD